MKSDCHRDERHPVPFVRQDDYGRRLYTFLLSYCIDGKQWSTEVWAYDFADAEARVAAMRESLRVDGQLFERFPA